MKRQYRHAVAAAVGVVLCAAASAQSPRDEGVADSQNRAQHSSQHRAAAAQPDAASSAVEDADEPRREDRERSAETETLQGSDRRASELIGAKVVTSEGEAVGEIDDLVVSTEDQSMHAVLSVGGLLGVGARLVRVPFEALQLQETVRAEDEPSSVRLAMTVDEIKSQPIFQYEDTQVSAAGPF